MKRLLFILFIMAATLMLFNCSENNPTSPESSKNDQTKTLTKIKTTVTAEADIVLPLISPGTTKLLSNGKTLMKNVKVRYNMEGSNPLFSGALVWKTNKLISVDKVTAKLWGKIELFVGVEPGNVDYTNAEGKWKIKFYGKKEGPIVTINAFGVGTEGIVKGMMGKWTFNMALPHPTEPWKKHFSIDGYMFNFWKRR